MARLGLALGTPLAVVALAVATMTVSAYSMSPPELSGRLVASSGFGTNANPTCTFSSDQSCIVAPAGTNWISMPPAQWCTVTGSVVGTTPNGSFQSETYVCAIGAVVLSFLASAAAKLVGIVNVSGPAQLWLQPSAIDCSLFGVTHAGAVPCAPPYGYLPPYSWNESTTSSGLLDLSNLPFDLGNDAGVIPPGTAWSLCFVDLSSENETVSVSASISLSPAA